MIAIKHQYVERETGKICTEPLFWDKGIKCLYTGALEKAPFLFRALTSARASSVFAYLNYDIPLPKGTRSFLKHCRVDFLECVERPEDLDTSRKVFERRIRYWQCRPMPIEPDMVVAPSDARVILGSLGEQSALFLKEKFFDFPDLLCRDKQSWISAFTDGDFAIFRLTPDKYHYNHTPVAGIVQDYYEVSGGYDSCNPAAVVAVVTPFSRNKRVVTIINTDVPGGSRVGMVAMIEIVALMIGDIEQVYSEREYENPKPLSKGMFLKKGVPKSLFRPGSSTVVLLFQKNRVRFARDIVRNMNRSDVQSRFSSGFGRALVETDLKVRSLIATAVARGRLDESSSGGRL